MINRSLARCAQYGVQFKAGAVTRSYGKRSKREESWSPLVPDPRASDEGCMLEPDQSARPAVIAIDYIKSQLFRVVHADGVIGGATPSGNVHLAFFSERPPIPRRDVRKVRPDGSLGESLPERMEIRDAIVREMDIDIVMSLPTVEALFSWLEQHLPDMRRAISSAGKREHSA